MDTAVAPGPVPGESNLRFASYNARFTLLHSDSTPEAAHPLPTAGHPEGV